MGNKSKKANVEVAAAPVLQSGKKGKRDAGKAIEKPVAKKQNNEVQKAIQSNAKKPKKAAAPPPKKNPEPSSSEEELEEVSSADEEPATKPVVAAKKSSAAPKKKAKPSSSEEESESEESDEEPANSVPTKQLSATTNGTAAPKDTEMDGSDSEDSEGSESDEEEVPATTNGAAVLKDTKMDEDDAEASDEGESDDEDEEPAKKVAAPTKVATKAAKEESDASDDDDSEDSDEEQAKPSAEGDSSEGGSAESSDESEDEKPSKPTKKAKDVEMKDTPSAKANQTPKNETKSGSKSVFVGNLSWSVDEDAVTEFFKEAGEVVDVRLATNPDGKLRGFGHVEFATPEGAQKALELNGKELLGRELRIDLAQQRDGSTPHSGKERGSFQKRTIFIKGFDKFQDEDQIKSSLEKHFGSCGEISRLSIPMDPETGASKGIAYVDFTDGNAMAKAMELNGSSIGDYLLTVDEAKPKGDNSGRSGGGRSGGRGRFGGGGGGRGGGRGRFGGGGRGGNRGRGRRSFWDD